MRPNPMYAVAAATAVVLCTPPTAQAMSAPATGRALTAVTCLLEGSGTYSPGLTNLSPRNVTLNATASGPCLDVRTDKSATGGHSITRRSTVATGSLNQSTCLGASGTLTLTVTWTLDDNTTRTSTATLTLPLANFLEGIPGTGTVANGLFAGATAENNTVFESPLAVAGACGSSTGLQGHKFTSETNILQ
ncbi:hypothetical protein OV450_8070 [Actinobacteria bacterium OV450]|nr:hypothetical protein OV450_8070 [Actinobacteria bacterium OV450]